MNITYVLVNPQGQDVRTLNGVENPLALPDGTIVSGVSTGVAFAGGWMIAVRSSALTKAQLHAYAATARWTKQAGGMTSQTFGPLRTDDQTTAMLTSLITSLNLSIVTEPINYKGVTGWASLTKAQLTAIAQEIAQYVQRCFNANMDIDGQIEAGTITTYEQIDAALQAVT